MSVKIIIIIYVPQSCPSQIKGIKNRSGEVPLVIIISIIFVNISALNSRSNSSSNDNNNSSNNNSSNNNKVMI